MPWTLLGLWVVVSPVAVLAGGGWLLWRSALAGRWSAPLRMPGVVGLVAAGVAGCAYTEGLLSAPWLDMKDACLSLNLRDGVVRERLFPISERCVERGADGGVELVPGWVNPLVVGGVLVAVAGFTVAAVRRVGRHRAERRRREELEWAELEAGSWRRMPDRQLD
ncbi:hypothetical protein AB0C76_23975 [Kitasatospora sp. NPDC048722]|uniref:hypothetical protein n=1 Tax=Kitasatospora sp. NPDC048722 TaxID=3155639 RepID=UPI0033EF37D9